MPLSSISLHNFRAFAGWQSLDLRPITLLFGSNNSGKSALLRSLPLIADSIPTGERANMGALNLKSSAARGASFKDLLWKGRAPEEGEELELEFEWSDTEEIARAKYLLRWREEINSAAVVRLEMSSRASEQTAEHEEEPRSLVWEWAESSEDLRRLPRLFSGKDDSGRVLEGEIDFRGLNLEFVSRSLDTDLIEGWGWGELRRALEVQLDQFASHLRWLTATRSPPTRLVPQASRFESRLEPDGANAASVLTARPYALEIVSSFFEETLKRQLEVLPVSAGLSRLILRPIDHPGYDIDLIDSGEGPLQVLPVLTLLALSYLEPADPNIAELREHPTILAIEEPESHLHPELQRALGAFICENLQRDTSVILETHSLQILLAVQLAVARGEVCPEDVALYWVQSQGDRSVAERISLDEDARPSSPRFAQMFNANTELTRELLDARRDRSR